MGIDVLGALRVGGSTPSLQRRDQVVLCALALRSGEALGPDRLAEALWGEQPPRSWAKVVQGCILRLRRTLGPASIETTSAGYRLALADDDVDSRRFEELVDRGVSLAATGEFDRAIVVFGRALELFRGQPFDVLDSWLPGRTEAARLDELRRSTEERLLDARLAAGEHRDVVAIA
jgi:DNA-binding SARP family transcriptional activator